MLELVPEQRYADRREAGRAVAGRLLHHRGHGPLVLALPRGGLPVAEEVARAIDGELDVLEVRKVGTPYQPELAMGAVTSTGAAVVNDDVVRAVGLSPSDVAAAVAAERDRLAAQARRIRGNRPPPDLRGRPVILVDDGLATGASMRAAVNAARLAEPSMIAVAVPVGPREAVAALGEVADEVVCPLIPSGFAAVGEWYLDFTQVTDDEARKVLEEAWAGG
jgi:putative phosphoribosyl transferase